MIRKVRERRLCWPAPSFFRRRPLMCAALSYLSGILLMRHIPYGAWMWVAAGSLFALGFCLARLRRGAALCVMLAMLLLGLARAGMEWEAPAMPPYGQWTATGTVDGEVSRSAKGTQFLLRDVQVQAEGGSMGQLQTKLYCFYPSADELPLRHGQLVSVKGASYRPSDRRNPGGFDQRVWLAQQGAHVRLYASEAPKILRPAAISLRGLAIAANLSLGERIDRIFGNTSPVVRAMLLGDQKSVPDDWSEWMQDSGIIHLLSVSGLHVALWCVMLERLLRPLPVGVAARWVLLLALLLLYCLLTGLQDSVIRSTIMLLIMQGGRVFLRKTDPLTSLSAAALGILLFRPLHVFAPGFQLSYGAVLGLTLLQPTLRRALPERLVKAADPLLTTLSAQIGVLPFISFWFGKVPLIGLVINLAAVPLAGLLMPVAAVAALLDAVWTPLAGFPAEAVKGMSSVLLLLAKGGAGATASQLRLPAFSWWAAAAFFACLLLSSTAVTWPWPKRLHGMSIIAGLAVCVGLLHGAHLVRYAQLDVGQALSGVLHVGRDAYVYDCGNENSDLTEYLTFTGARVRGVFLSHPHSDHTGGLTELLAANIPIGAIYVPAAADAFGAESGYHERLAQAAKRGIPIVEVAAGDALSLSGLRAEIVAPERQPGEGKDPNERSIVLRVQIGEQSLLLCGDADGASEPLGIDCDVLQVAHHGSRNAAGEKFLADATPEIALISVGANSYGHPHEETLARLAGAAIYLTRDSGALTVYFGRARKWVEAFCP